MSERQPLESGGVIPAAAQMTGPVIEGATPDLLMDPLTLCQDEMRSPLTVADLLAWGRAMQGGDTSQMLDL